MPATVVKLLYDVLQNGMFHMPLSITDVVLSKGFMHLGQLAWINRGPCFLN